MNKQKDFDKDINVRSKTELTNEEIVKDMIAHKEAAEIYSFVQITANQMNRWLDLIHRLQSEIGGYISDQGILLQEIDKEYALRLKHQFACEKKDLELKQLEFEKAELQKQVDELKNRRIEPKIFQCHANALENCPKVEQAEKDAAEKFAEKLFDFLDDYALFDKRFLERKINEICKEITEGKKNENS